jgi:hypothetical protein
VSLTVDDLPGRVEAALLGALAGEEAAGVAAGAADLLGVAESAAAAGGFDEDDLHRRGLERPSRSGSAGLLLRALPFGLLTPLDRPRLRRDAYRCVALAGADEGTAITAVATAILVADLLRFDLSMSLVRVRQSLLEDAPMALLQRLAPLPEDAAGANDADPGAALQGAITALARGGASIAEAVGAAAGGPAVAVSLAGALAGAHGGREALAGVDIEHLAHAEAAKNIAARLAERAIASLPTVVEA